MRVAPLAAVIIAVLVPSVAIARDDAPWATVNVCNTADRPDAIGIRASMPGAPKGARMAMRFRVQFKADEGWQDVKGASSRWQPVGTARGLAAESGWSFSFARPSS